MQVNSMKEAAGLVGLVSNIVIVEAKDEINRQTAMGLLLSEMSSTPKKFYNFDEIRRLTEMEVRKGMENSIHNFKFTNDIFDHKTVEIKQPTPHNIIAKMQDSIRQNFSLMQITFDNEIFAAGKAKFLLEAFLRHVYSYRDEEAVEMNEQGEEVGTRKDFTTKSVIMIITDDLNQFKSLGDNVISVRFQSEQMLIDRVVEKIFENADYVPDGYVMQSIRTMLAPMNLSQITNFMLQLNQQDLKTSEELREFTVKYVGQVLSDDEILEKLDTDGGFERIGGYKQFKQHIQEQVINIWRQEERAKAMGMEVDKGMLLFGLPGVGKTMVAQALAGELKLPAYKFNVSKILNQYVGASEKNLQKVFDLLEEIAPAILFIDELDSIGGNRSSTHYGASSYRNVINMLLQYLSDPNRKTLVIGATNLMEQMDDALIRSGRLGSIFYIPHPDLEARREIFNIHLNVKRKIPNSVDLDRVAELTDKWTGAEIEEVIKRAARKVVLQKEEDAEMNTLQMEQFIKNFNLSTKRDEMIAKYEADKTKYQTV